MVICDKQEHVYIAIPKTASSTVADYLCRYEGGHREGDHHSIDIPAYAKDFLVWCSVRNPYERLYSWWYWRCIERRNPDGWTFVKHMEDVLKWSLAPGGYAKTNMSHIYKTISWWVKHAGIKTYVKQEEMPQAIFEHPVIGPRLENRYVDTFSDVHGQATKRCRTPALELMSDYERRLVNEYCPDDFALLGYEMVE